MITCTGCGVPKDEEEFYPGNKKCKDCYGTKGREYKDKRRIENPEKCEEKIKCDREKQRQKSKDPIFREKKRKRSKEVKQKNRATLPGLFKLLAQKHISNDFGEIYKDSPKSSLSPIERVNRYRLQAATWKALLERIEELWKEQKGLCCLCGDIMIPYHEVNTMEFRERHHDTISVDRIDNAKLHTPDNVGLAHLCCNTMRGALSIEEFYEYCRKAITYHTAKKNQEVDQRSMEKYYGVRPQDRAKTIEEEDNKGDIKVISLSESIE